VVLTQNSPDTPATNCVVMQSFPTDDGAFVFWLDCRVGSGGESQVFLGVHRETGTPVAIKWLCEMFERPAPVCLPTHPSLALPIATTAFSGVPAEVYQLYYCDLEEVVAHGSLAEAAAQQVIRVVVEAISAFHRVGLAHGDLKLANLLMDVHGRVVVGDFGTVRPLHDLKNYATTIRCGTDANPDGESFPAGYDIRWQDTYAIGVIAKTLLGGAVVSPAASDFVSCCTNVDPKLRPTCDRLLDHCWLTAPVSAECVDYYTPLKHVAKAICGCDVSSQWSVNPVLVEFSADILASLEGACRPIVNDDDMDVDAVM
jgi:serine/threonine protein kinase